MSLYCLLVILLISTDLYKQKFRIALFLFCLQNNVIQVNYYDNVYLKCAIRVFLLCYVLLYKTCNWLVSLMWL